MFCHQTISNSRVALPSPYPTTKLLLQVILLLDAIPWAKFFAAARASLGSVSAELSVTWCMHSSECNYLSRVEGKKSRVPNIPFFMFFWILLILFFSLSLIRNYFSKNTVLKYLFYLPRWLWIDFISLWSYFLMDFCFNQIKLIYMWLFILVQVFSFL